MVPDLRWPVLPHENIGLAEKWVGSLIAASVSAEDTGLFERQAPSHTIQPCFSSQRHGEKLQPERADRRTFESLKYLVTILRGSKSSRRKWRQKKKKYLTGQESLTFYYFSSPNCLLLYYLFVSSLLFCLDNYSPIEFSPLCRIGLDTYYVPLANVLKTLLLLAPLQGL